MPRHGGRAGPIALVAILAVAAWLRFAAIDFGAGFDARPDEPGTIWSLAYMRTGSILAPSLVAYGGGYMYPLYALASTWSWLAWPDGLVAHVTSAPDEVKVVARGWSALLSTLTVCLVYASARAVGGRAVGLVAAALMASNTLAVREAHFAKADSAAALAAALLLLTLVARPRVGAARALAIGAAAGLAACTKACIGFLPAVFIALVTPPEGHPQGRDTRSLWMGCAGLLVVVALLNAFWLTSPTQAWTFSRAIARAVTTPSYLPGGDTVSGPLQYHTVISLRFGCGLVVALLTVPAIAFALYRGGLPRLVAISVLGHWTMLLANPMVLARYFLPSLPGLAVLLAGLMVAAIDDLTPKQSRRWVLATITALAVSEPLLNGVTLVRLLGRDDTRALAGDWISSHVPPAAKIVIWGAPPGASDFGHPPVGPRPMFQRLPPEQWQRAGIALVVQHSYPLAYSADPLPRDGTPLRRVALFDPFQGTPRSPVLEPIDAFYLPLARFSGIQRPGPRIEIFALVR